MMQKTLLILFLVLISLVSFGQVTSEDIQSFIDAHEKILPEIVRITKDGGSICWQVGYHVKDGEITPLDYLVHAIIKKEKEITLRNRIVWTYGHGLHCSKRFSGRHETVLWYTKGKKYLFDLDNVRVPQKYPGKKYYKGSKKGQYSGNPLGKNPSDVWEIPNIKANHIEKTNHPCQYPVALVQRLIKAFTPIEGVVFDPFMGAGSAGVAAIVEKRKFIGCEINKKYYITAKKRCNNALKGEEMFRSCDKEIAKPNLNRSVAQKPVSFKY